MFQAIQMTSDLAELKIASGDPGCPNCNCGTLRPTTISAVFWRGDDAMMIRGIPALGCGGCGEEFISDDTAIELDRIKGMGFNGTATATYTTIPVYTLASVSMGSGG